ncbi:MAG TPA: nuclear transport factor 2 family protein, partial [Saprospiraceae bacterium]|nr:nuclear transport factor 2 family protein [Saprospiraceae bacterium]
MKLSKQTEAEIRQVYQSYWDAYLHGDFETFGSFLDDNIVIYGTAEGEIFYTKEDALKFYIATAEEMTGKADFRNRNINIQPVGDTIVIYEESQLYILIEGTWTFYGSARITGIFEKKGNEWKLVHQHGSFPDGRTEEGQQIASEKIKEENLQLREAVKRRTVELENKTRELEIESSLERVRTVAMGMRKPEDMLSVCEVISNQLLALGIHDIRNVQTAIVEGREDGYYMNYQYFPQYLARITEVVEIAKHPN